MARVPVGSGSGGTDFFGTPIFARALNDALIGGGGAAAIQATGFGQPAAQPGPAAGFGQGDSIPNKQTLLDEDRAALDARRSAVPVAEPAVNPWLSFLSSRDPTMGGLNTPAWRRLLETQFGSGTDVEQFGFGAASGQGTQDFSNQIFGQLTGGGNTGVGPLSQRFGDDQQDQFAFGFGEPRRGDPAIDTHGLNLGGIGI